MKCESPGSEDGGTKRQLAATVERTP